ncbi:MAG TPA: efflux RND transporter periplasmic adaptor subunit [Bacteroidales bacterium]|nr:efflux RND transporter periplasmic adaptor subunit [Bacteroidales bacterium]
MRTQIYIIFSLTLILGIGLNSCGNKGNAEVDAKKEEKKVQPVKVINIESQNVTRDLSYTASISAFEELYLAPASPGRIHKIFVEVGDRVSSGQLIAEMDPTQLNQTKLQLLSLEKDFERMDTLLAVGGVSKQQYDQIKTQLDITQSNVEFLEENVYLKSPFNGIVTGKYFENGELYSGAPNTQVGKAAIVTLQQIQPVKAIINVSEKYYPVIKKNMTANIKLDIYPNEIFVGKIHLIHPTISAITRTFPVEIIINNSEEKLRPGMFARVEMELGEENVLILPVSAILQQTGTNNKYVFVHNNGIAKRYEVNTGNRYNDLIEIISDELDENDEIIISGHINLVDGQSVEVVE